MKQFADAANEYGEVIASSPASSPAMQQSRWSPAVPLETAAAYGAPTLSAKRSSNSSIRGPSERRPDRRTSRTSSSSRSSRYAPESGTVRVTLTLRRRLAGGHDVEPLRPTLVRALHRVQIGPLDLRGDRPRSADLVVVHRVHRRDLRGGAGHEELVRDVEIRPDQSLLHDRIAEVGLHLDDRVARDP